MKLLMAIMSLMMAAGLCGCAQEGGGNNMELTCFDVGKADCFLLQCDGNSLLIDTGTANDGAEVAQELTKMGVNSIQTLIITHFDRDHVGGAAQLIGEFGIKTLIRPVYMKESEESAACMAAAEEAGVTVITVESEQSLSMGLASLKIYPARQAEYEKNPSNNSSLLTVVSHGENRFLFTGDAQKERIAEIMDTIDDGGYVFLKQPYHGEYMKCLPEFIARVKPEYAVITSSNKNPEDAETISALEAAGAKCYLTKNGTVYVSSNGKAIRISQ